jgi:hypothetical protein
VLAISDLRNAANLALRMVCQLVRRVHDMLKELSAFAEVRSFRCQLPLDQEPCGWRCNRNSHSREFNVSAYASKKFQSRVEIGRRIVRRIFEWLWRRNQCVDELAPGAAKLTYSFA